GQQQVAGQQQAEPAERLVHRLAFAGRPHEQGMHAGEEADAAGDQQAGRIQSHESAKCLSANPPWPPLADMLPTSLPRTQANPAGWAPGAAAGDTDHIRSPRRGSMVGGVSIRPRPVVEVKAISTPTPPAEIAPGIDYFFALRPDDRARAEIADAAA